MMDAGRASHLWLYHSQVSFKNYGYLRPILIFCIKWEGFCFADKQQQQQNQKNNNKKARCSWCLPSFYLEHTHVLGPGLGNHEGSAGELQRHLALMSPTLLN